MRCQSMRTASCCDTSDYTRQCYAATGSVCAACSPPNTPHSLSRCRRRFAASLISIESGSQASFVRGGARCCFTPAIHRRAPRSSCSGRWRGRCWWQGPMETSRASPSPPHRSWRASRPDRAQRVAADRHTPVHPKLQRNLKLRAERRGVRLTSHRPWCALLRSALWGKLVRAPRNEQNQKARTKNRKKKKGFKDMITGRKPGRNAFRPLASRNDRWRAGMLRALAALLALTGTVADAASTPAQTVHSLEVMHWLTSGRDAAALAVIRDRFVQQGGAWTETPMPGAGETGRAAAVNRIVRPSTRGLSILAGLSAV